MYTNSPINKKDICVQPKKDIFYFSKIKGSGVFYTNPFLYI